MKQTKFPVFQVDAFADKVFTGNPAACCPLTEWLPDELLQSIAAENNLSETAFWVAKEEAFHLRWFTPLAEVDLCGHATLASAHVMFNHLGFREAEIRFVTRSGDLTVVNTGQLLEMDFPAIPVTQMDFSERIAAALGRSPVRLFKGPDIMAVFDNEEDILALQPDYPEIAAIDTRAIVATAPGRESDFVSRFFAPRVGVPEDPVTGSAHCILAPYWANVLGKEHLHAIQRSARGGKIECKVRGDRVLLRGGAVTYMQGEICL